MKKTLTAVALLAGAVAGYSQGEIQFNMNTTGEKQAVFNTQVSDLVTGTAVTFGGYTVYETQGSSSYQNESPTGSAVYTGAALGNGYSAELLIGTTAANMQPFGGNGQSGGSVASFLTGAKTLGYISAAQSISLPTATGYAVGDVVDIAVAAWNNEGGTVTTLAAAQAADASSPNSDPWGISNVVTYTLSGPPGTPPAPTGITSFDLGTVASIPEPSTIALGVMGASTLLFRRRK